MRGEHQDDPCRKLVKLTRPQVDDSSKHPFLCPSSVNYQVPNVIRACSPRESMPGSTGSSSRTATAFTRGCAAPSLST